MKVSQKTRVTESTVDTLARLGLHLREFRLAKRMTHEQAALEAGFSRQTLSRIERGDPSVAIGQVMRYLEVVQAQAVMQLPKDVDLAAPRKRVRLSTAERNPLEAAAAA